MIQYNSTTEYFAIVQNRSLIFFLISLLLFCVLFYLMMTGILTAVMLGEQGLLVAGVLTFISLMDGVVAFLLGWMLLKKAKQLEGLGERLDKYASVTFIRFAMLLSGSIMLMIAFYISGIQWIILVYGVYLIFFLISWPSRSRLCTELGLNANEREVIFGK